MTEDMGAEVLQDDALKCTVPARKLVALILYRGVPFSERPYSDRTRMTIPLIIADQARARSRCVDGRVAGRIADRSRTPGTCHRPSGRIMTYGSIPIEIGFG